MSSKILLETSYYKGSTTGIPVRWSPPEVIEYGKYTTASDTWSYGVSLWELFNRGRVTIS
jgi:serine/threonine protein kinase